MKLTKYIALAILVIELHLISLNRGGTDYHNLAFWYFWVPLILATVALLIFVPYRYKIINYLVILVSVLVIAFGVYRLRNSYINEAFFYIWWHP
jgi:uncharacterized membrane protein